MVKVIGTRFYEGGKLFFFDPGDEQPANGSYVLVDTVKGTDLAEVVMAAAEMDETFLKAPLKPIIRIATEKDLEHLQENKKLAGEAYSVCQDKIAEHHLDMKLVRVEVPFDNNKMLFYFTANGRVDFRALVKDLASVYRTRIELRQIGVRDEARMLGGLGPCGRHICCDAFLNDFQPVSIKMAKEQKLSLNPTKISGVCGRLMCCLKYEEDQYEAIHRRMPKVGREIQTPDGVGVIIAQNILRESVSVRMQHGESGEVREYTLDELFPESAAASSEGTHADEGNELPDVSEEGNVELEESASEELMEEGRNEEDDTTVFSGDTETESRRNRENRPRRAKGKAGTQPADEKTVQDCSMQNEVPDSTSLSQEKKVETDTPRSAASSWKEALEKAMEAASHNQM